VDQHDIIVIGASAGGVEALKRFDRLTGVANSSSVRWFVRRYLKKSPTA